MIIVELVQIRLHPNVASVAYAAYIIGALFPATTNLEIMNLEIKNHKEKIATEPQPC